MKAKRISALFSGASLFLILLLCAQSAREGTAAGINTCIQVIIPSLFPFFVAASLLMRLGLPEALGTLAAPFTARLFGVSGEGASVFLLGLFGGYPLGAAATADLFRSGKISRNEAERLLAFCDNSGPAFIVGAAGVGIFGSAAIGFLLYLVHVIASAFAGLLLSFPRRNSNPPAERTRFHLRAVSLSKALSESVRGSVRSMAAVCGFVIFFSAFLSVLDAVGLFSAPAGALAIRFGTELRFTRALLTGFWELGSGIGTMAGLAPSRGNLVLAAGLLGWGGISVHFQALGILSGTELSMKRHFFGKVLHAVLSAALTWCLAGLL